MRPRSAAALACRIIAIFVGIQVVTQTIAWLIFAASEFSGSGSFWAYNATSGVIAWFLWTSAGRLADAMARDLPDELAQGRSTANTHAAALSIVGIVVIVTAIPPLIGVLVSEEPSFGGFGLFGFPGGSFGYARAAAVAIELIRLAIGVTLIVTSGSLARSMARMYPEPEPPAGGPSPGSP